MNPLFYLSIVRVFIDDARSFLKKNDDKYDMIILGTLDSHALLSAMSTVRLDNFVYTVESLGSVKRHLNEKGIVVLMFSVAQPWIGEKLINMVSTVFEEPRPIAYLGTPNLFNLMIVGGPGLKEVIKNGLIEKSSFQQIPNNLGGQNLPTDDWPYLYLLDRKIPSHYLKAIAILLAISIIAIFVLSPKNIFNRSGLNFFSLGAAFLLLETKSVTTLSLLFGSTWLVNVFVFGSILTMILLANLLVSKIDIKRIWIVYACLGLTLLLNYFLPTGYFLSKDFWIRSILSSFTIALPIFFAAIIFSFHVGSGRKNDISGNERKV